MNTVIFDLECNGLLHDATRIHCLALYEGDTDEIESYNDESPGKGLTSPVIRALQYIEQAPCVIGHNIIGFDIPVIKSIYPWFNPVGTIVDTLILSRLYHPDLFDIDKKRKYKYMLQQMYGRHSLEAWGYRLGEYKGSFSKTTDWKEWSQDMEDYCIQDVVVTKKLCDHFHPYLSGSR